MRIALVLFLLAALALPEAHAQLPSVCGPVTATQPANPTPIRPGESAEIVVSVQNGGSVPATVEVAGQTSSPGWSITTSPAPASVAAGGTGQFRFVVAAGERAADDATVSFQVSGTCDSPLGNACAQPCNAGSMNTQASVPLAAPEGFTIPGLENLDIPLEYLIAAVLLVATASAIPFLMRRKKTGIFAQCPEPLKLVKPGRGTSFPIELRNAAKEPGVAQFEVGAVPEGWNAFMPLPEVQLAAREARSFWLMVRAPPTAAVGDAVEVELRVKDGRMPTPALVKVRAEVQPGAPES